VAVLGQKFWGSTAPWRTNVPRGLRPEGQSEGERLGERCKLPQRGSGPQTHFGRIYSPENAPIDTTRIIFLHKKSNSFSPPQKKWLKTYFFDVTFASGDATQSRGATRA